MLHTCPTCPTLNSQNFVSRRSLHAFRCPITFVLPTRASASHPRKSRPIRTRLAACSSKCYSRYEVSETRSFREGATQIPTQGESLVRGMQPSGLQLQEQEPPADVDFLSELMAMQENGPKNLGFFGTRNMGFLHQNLIEVLSYAMVLTGNHIFTSGATGTNAAVIKGALRAEKPDLLTVVLPQSLSRQPPESQDLLSQVKAENLIEMPQNDDLQLLAASRICNRDIVSRVQQVICFAFHDSKLLLETCEEAKETRKMVTLFYLD